MTALEKLLKTATPEQILRALANIFSNLAHEHKQEVKRIVAHVALNRLPDNLRHALAEPILKVEAELLLPFVEDADYREAVQAMPAEWQKLVIALHVRKWYGVPDASVTSAFVALAEDGSLKQAIARQHRIDRNPGGTGKNPEYEREVAESNLDLPEDVSSPLELATSNEPDPAEVVENADLLERVFEHLKAEEQVILQMFADGHTDEEVAVLLGTTPEAIKKRRQRLINRLRQSLAS